MKHIHNKLLITCLFYCILLPLSGYSEIDNIKQSDQTIGEIYKTLNSKQTLKLTDRLDIISQSFLGKPYILGALGEGPKARFDQSPLYRVDGFDCETYVDTVLAIALANNVQEFRQCINHVRYRHGQIGYLTRNHFASLDWNINNQHQGFVKDITLSIKDINNQPVALMAIALIDKPSWYQHKTIESIKLNPPADNERAKRLEDLKALGSLTKKATARIPYLPLTALFDKEGKANMTLFNQIPHGSIVEIVRPNWDLVAQIGTHLNVSHLGFAFWKNNTLFFREASSVEKKVIDIPLIDYLYKTRESPTIKGINVQVIIPKNSSPSVCG